MYTAGAAQCEDLRCCSGQVLALESAQHLGMSWDENCNRPRFRLARYYGPWHIAESVGGGAR